MPDKPFHLSVVATSRNDNHGKNLLYRMQCFVNGFIEQCKRHHLKAELILVEWNPPEETLPLAQALCFPQDKGPCSIRIIRVPKETHSKLEHADKIPLFQMIGKNVGIRRALGKFILATNIDILFSDKIIKFMKRRLAPGYLYRVDRLDIPEMLPQANSFDEIMEFCFKNFFRINSKIGTLPAKRESVWKKLYLLFKLPLRLLSSLFKKILHASLMSLLTKTIPLTISTFKIAKQKVEKYVKALICYSFPHNSLILHTNACGDFTLLSAEDWAQLKGYPEWNIFSWHIDSVLLYQARQHDIKERNLSMKMPIFHIEHEVGSGYSPEGAEQLFQRLDAKGIPYLSNAALKKLVTELNHSKEKVIYNDDTWGMSDMEFEETIV